MSLKYWKVPKSSLDAHVTDEDTDSDGIIDYCRQYENYANAKKSPVASLDLGDVTQVVLKNDNGADLSSVYAGATEYSYVNILTEIHDPNKNWFKPDVLL